MNFVFELHTNMDSVFLEWGRVLGIIWDKDRPCYIVRFIDDVLDTWPVYDPSDPYEFRAIKKI
jgi:hypothetical protein